MLNGKLIHQTADEYGSIKVVDYAQQLRALHFDNNTQQSTCLLCNPNFLVHKYAQAITLPLCWLKPKRILLLGLGAGSLVKFFYKYYPDTIIDAVELRPEVTQVASKFFMLPTPNERFNIYHSSAGSWLEKEQLNQYELIITDIFLTSDTGEDITVDISNFFDRIYQLLTAEGCAVFNHLDDNKPMSYPGFQALSTIFTQQIYSISNESSNSILYTSRGALPQQINTHVYKHQANTTKIAYQQYFDQLQAL